jgi:hypothetical protein
MTLTHEKSGRKACTKKESRTLRRLVEGLDTKPIASSHAKSLA